MLRLKHCFSFNEPDIHFVFLLQDDVAGCFEYYADLAEALDGKQRSQVSLPMETFKCHILREPIGVVGLITPWYLSELLDTFSLVFDSHAWLMTLGIATTVGNFCMLMSFWFTVCFLINWSLTLKYLYGLHLFKPCA